MSTNNVIQRALDQKLHNKVAKMSKEQLNREIDKRLDVVNSGKLEGELLELEKAELVALAEMSLRRSH